MMSKKAKKVAFVVLGIVLMSVTMVGCISVKYTCVESGCSSMDKNSTKKACCDVNSCESSHSQ